VQIVKAEVLVASPGRNFVTLRITTDDGFVGLGDATLNGRELAAASYLGEHVVPLLVGRDAHQIEDTWQYLYRGGYWRGGPVTMAAIAAVDTALWDIKAKVAGMPLYQLLGGASRRGLLASRRASRRSASRAESPACDPSTGSPRAATPASATVIPATTMSPPGAAPSLWRRPGTPVPTCATCPPCSKRCGASSVPSWFCCMTRTTGSLR
jgi:L-alanine-DL-glutamate epimerase-like enolase superfamily enzyme